MVLQRGRRAQALPQYEDKIKTKHMALKRKILAWAFVTALAIPAVMVFNDNADAVHINIIGLAYTYFMTKYAEQIVPQWMRDYFSSLQKLNDEFDD